MDPYIQKSSDWVIEFQAYTGLPWPAIFSLICLALRIGLLPLFLTQVKRISMFATKINLSKEIKLLVDNTNLPKFKRYRLLASLFMRINKEMKLKPLRLVFYNLLHLPFLFLFIMTIRRTISNPLLRENSFMWMPTFISTDPYYILPIVTCSIFYYTFGKGINALNRDTVIGRVRSTCQTLMILWLPILSSWPGPIVFYIMCNAIFSLAQSKFSNSLTAIKYLNPKVLFSMMMYSSQQTQKDYHYKHLNNIFKCEPPKYVSEEMVLQKAKMELQRRFKK
jgi:membrane protein insertase Oxa1/YidC/SpoIIIJ